MPPPANLTPRANYNPSTARAWAAGWDYPTARLAVDEQIRGRFANSYQLAIDLERHPAAKAARRQRRSAITSQPWVLRGPERAPGRIELEAAARTWKKIRSLLGAIEDDLGVHGLCVLQHPLHVVETEVGPRYEVQSVEVWPLACVELGSALLGRDASGPYDPDRLYARTAPGSEYPWTPLPNPGETDLHWTVIGDPLGWRRGAIVACDLEYVASQMGRRGWAQLQVMLGKASILGEMPEDTPLVETDADGNENATSVGAQMQALAEAIGETQTAGIHPNGAKFYPLQVTASTAELLPQSIDASCRMFALAILGHDSGVTRGTSVYNDPRSQDVPQDLARDDAQLIAAPIGDMLTGVARLNCERCAPIYPDPQIPDSDQDMRREEVQKRRAADDEHLKSKAERRKAVADSLAAERDAGVLIDEEHVERAYLDAGLEPPRLAPRAAPREVAAQPAPPGPAGPEPPAVQALARAVVPGAAEEAGLVLTLLALEGALAALAALQAGDHPDAYEEALARASADLRGDGLAREYQRDARGRFGSGGGGGAAHGDGPHVVHSAGTKHGFGTSKAAKAARTQSDVAKAASAKALGGGSHEEAAKAHSDAAAHHREAAARSVRSDYREAHEKAAAAHEAAAKAHADEHAKASDPHESFAKDLHGKKLENVKAFGKKKGEVRGVNEIQTAKAGGHDVFVKPATTHFDPKKAVDDHHAVATSAREMGVGHLVMPAALHKDNKGRAAFVTKSAGEGFSTARSNVEAAKKIGEHDRLAGALIDHLHANGDRHANNVLVHPSGRMVLIDHDYAHEYHGGMRSVFAHDAVDGLSLTYKRGSQKSIHDLPPKFQEHVRALSHSTDAEVAKKYRVNEHSARAMRRRAEHIEKHGLDSSIDTFD